MAVTKLGIKHKEDLHKLTKFIIPELRTVLDRQQRDYGIDAEAFSVQVPVEEQASNIDDTPVHNIGMERQCGKIDYRLY